MLETSLDNKEITSMQFADPIDIMQRHLNGELWLAPPQFWEISRMINIHNFVNRLRDIEWGNDISLQIIAELFKIKINILSVTIKSTYVNKIEPKDNIYNNDLPNIWLGHISEFHYVSTIEIFN